MLIFEIFSICSADFSVERNEFYPEDEEEEELLDEDESGNNFMLIKNIFFKLRQIFRLRKPRTRKFSH